MGNTNNTPLLQHPPKRPIKPFSKRGTSLHQLILLQEWQRVLIRVRLFPEELQETRVHTIFGTKFWLLPLHLACAVQAPAPVIELFLEIAPGAASMPIRKFQRRRERRRYRAGPPSRRLSRVGPQEEQQPLQKTSHKPIIKEMDMAEDREVLLHCPASVYFFHRQPYELGNPDLGSSLEESSLSSHNSFCRGMVLQLSPSGSIHPMPLCDTASTTSDQTSSCFCVSWDLDPLLTYITTEPTSLLPLHLACLYQSDSQVVHALIQAHPAAALVDIMGMLPIHWVAAGWILPPLQTTASSMLFAPESHGPLPVLKVLHRAVPSPIRSGNHGMTPIEYVQECMEKGDYRERCLRVLMDLPEEIVDLGEESYPRTGLSIVFADVSETSSMMEYTPAAVTCLSERIVEKDWESVISVIEDDSQVAGKWLYGVDEDDPVAVWKRLPLHLVCAHNAPVQLVALVVDAYPTAVSEAEPQSGFLPLHFCCQVGATLPIVKLLLDACPGSTKAVDRWGRLPIHVAVRSSAPYAVVEALVECDPISIVMIDMNGRTAIDYAIEKNQSGNVVTELLTMTQLFLHESASVH